MLYYKHMRIFAISALLALLVGVASPFSVPTAQAQTAAEAGFSMNTIIGDDQMTDYLSMSVGRIQEFLNAQTGALDTYVDSDGRSAAQEIYDAAQTYQINPKVLIVTLQKEQSIISDPNPTQREFDYALGYGCPDSSPCNPIYKGFGIQIAKAASAFRRWIDNVAIGDHITTNAIATLWGPGLTNNYICDSGGSNDSGRGLCVRNSTIQITPTNAATAALYTYTPHPGGNYLFWTIWKNFNFNMRRVYPDGTLLQAKGSKDIYIIQNGTKRRFATQNVLLASSTLKKVITVSVDTLLQYESGKTIYFANYSLVKAPNKGIYLIANDTKRAIKSKAALLKIGIDPKTAVPADWDILNEFADGAAITTDAVYPAGALVQNSKNGMVFFVKDGIKYPVPTKDIMKSQFGSKKTIKLTPQVLETYTWGAFVGFKDGELVQSTTGGPVYFISNGFKLPIMSPAAAKAFGFDKIMKNLIKTNDKSIEVHPLGPGLDVDSNMVSLASK